MGYRSFTFRVAFVLVLVAALAGAAARVFFSSQESVEREILRLIDESDTSVDVALFELRSARLIKSLQRAEGRGVRVRLILDSSRSANAVALREVRGLGGKWPKRRGVMHNKFALFDQQQVVTGSYNWTAGAEHSNYENAVLIDDPGVVRAYANEFDRLWKRSSSKSPVFAPFPYNRTSKSPTLTFRKRWGNRKKGSKRPPSRHARIEALR